MLILLYGLICDIKSLLCDLDRFLFGDDVVVGGIAFSDFRVVVAGEALIVREVLKMK